MFTAALGMTDKRKEQARCPQTNKWTNKMTSTHAEKSYPDISSGTWSGEVDSVG